MGALRFDLIETQEGFRAIEAQWRTLERRAGPGNFYASFDWVMMAWPQSARPVAIATVWEGERLSLGLPLHRVRGKDGSLRFVGMLGALIQFVDALIDDDADDHAAVTLMLRGLRDVGHGRSLQLVAVPAGSPIASLAPMSAAAVIGQSPQIDMPEGFAAYFAQRSHNMRADHGRMMRRLGATVRVADSQSWEEDLDWLLATKRAWTPRERVPLRPWVSSRVARDGLVALGRLWVDDGRAVMTLLESAGKRVAAGLNFRLGTVATFYATTYAAAQARHSPGHALMVENLKVLAALGVKRVDLMPYRAAYKERVKTSSVLLRSVKLDL